MILYLIPLLFGLDFYSPQTGNIEVTIEGITKENGKMIIALFDNRQDFNITPIKYFNEPVNGKNSITVTFPDVPYNSYAISVYQDLNDNGKLEKNFLGIPTEPYGFSNNPKIITGPSYEKSIFSLKKKTLQLNIQLH